MTVDSANRSFLALVATALVPYALLALFGCAALSLMLHHADRLGAGGLFLAVMGAAAVAAVVSMRRQVVATRAFARSLRARTLPVPPAVAAAAQRHGLVDQVDVIDDADRFSFTYGLRTGRVALSRGLVDALERDELDAVLAHERYHVRNHDTLKMVVARAASAALFFLPALWHLRARYLVGRELAADRAATRASGRRSLAGALARVMDQTGPVGAGSGVGVGGVAALAGHDVFELRLTQLETGQEPSLAPVPRGAVGITAVVLVGLSGTFLVTLAQLGRALPTMHGASSFGVAVLGSLACAVAWAGLGVLAVCVAVDP